MAFNSINSERPVASEEQTTSWNGCQPGKPAKCEFGAKREEALIYHITDLANLLGILIDGRLNSDAIMADKNPET